MLLFQIIWWQNWNNLFETILQLCIVCVKSSSKIYNLSRFIANKKGKKNFQSWSYAFFRLHSMIRLYKLPEDLVWIWRNHVRKADRGLSAKVNLKWDKEHHWLGLHWEVRLGKADSCTWIPKWKENRWTWLEIVQVNKLYSLTCR